MAVCETTGNRPQTVLNWTQTERELAARGAMELYEYKSKLIAREIGELFG